MKLTISQVLLCATRAITAAENFDFEAKIQIPQNLLTKEEFVQVLSIFAEEEEIEEEFLDYEKNTGYEYEFVICSLENVLSFAHRLRQVRNENEKFEKVPLIVFWDEEVVSADIEQDDDLVLIQGDTYLDNTLIF